MDRIKIDELVGKEVLIKYCQATVHGGHPECVCHLVGKVVRISERNNSFPVSYEVAGGRNCVRRNQIIPMPVK